MPEPTGPSWKHGGSSANKGTSRKAWQPGKSSSTPTPRDPNRSRRRRLLGAAVTGSLLLGAIVAAILLWNPPRRPSLLSLAPDEASSTVLPLNTWGRLAEGSLESLGQTPYGPIYLASKGNNADNFLDQIDKSQQPLILHYALSGGGDKQGPYLWVVPKEAPLAAPSHRVNVSSILNRLRDLPAQRSKVVIFDVAVDNGSWTRGELHNDFARRLKALDGEIKNVPNLTVICSAGEDQRSWIAEEWQRTVFGHFLEEGLKGAAGTANAPISAHDLFKYLDKKTSEWAQANRDAEQRPLLLPTTDADEARNGEKRASKTILATLGSKAYLGLSATEAPGSSFAIPKELTEAWTRAFEIAALSPAPEIRAPHLWRQYLDLLLRTEKIARISGGVPAECTTRLSQLAQQIAASPWNNEPACLPYSLPAARALGYSRKTLEPDLFKSVWEAMDRSREWETIAKNLDPDRFRSGVRLAGSDAILTHLLKEQLPAPAALARASELLEFIDGGAPRPTETQLLRILQKHLDQAQRDPALVRLALAVHAEGEQSAWFAVSGEAYPYAEQVSRWFDEPLRAADEQRRQGLDLLFSSESKDWAKSQEALTNARTLYGKLNEQAQVIGTALRLRDRLFSRLPFYAHWAAGRRVDTQSAKPMLDLVEETALKAHYLSDLLQQPSPSKVAAVQEVVRDLEGTPEQPGLFRKLESTFEQSLTTLGKTAVPSNWHEIDNALQVPWIPVTKRMELLTTLRSISRRLNEQADPQGAKSAAPAPLEMAKRQGRMALAILGEPQVSRFRGNSPLGWGELKQRVQAPDLGAWWDSLAEAGEQIGAVYRTLPQESQRLTQTGWSQGDPKALTEGAQLARLTLGSTLLLGPNPVALERRAGTMELLIALAKRSAADGWADLDPIAPQPYCLKGAKAYLDSAESILFDDETTINPVERDRRLKPIATARAALQAPRFDFALRENLDLTDAALETLPYQVRSEGATGYPVLRVRELTPPLNVKDWPKGSYQPLNEFVKARPDPLESKLNLVVAPSSDGTTAEVKVDLLYRGRLETRTCKARYAGLPTYQWIYRPPTNLRASFAIKGDEALRNGAIAILFDGTDSMNIPSKGGKGTRFEEAAEGLRTVLRRIPRGTYVSVHLFGTKSGMKTVAPPTRWSQPDAQASQVCGEILKVGADGESTPLAQAIGSALSGDGFFPRGGDFNGTRNLVVLTDGAENVSDNPKAPTSQPGKTVVADLLRAPNDVGLHLVLFGVEKGEYDTARIQFDVLEETKSYETSGRTIAQIWPRKDQFKTDPLNRAAHLANVLKEAMLPRTSVRRDEVSLGNLPVSIAADNFWNWFPLMDPGVVQLGALGSRQKLQLDPGDRLLLELKQTKQGTQFSIPSYADVRPDLGITDRATSADRTVFLTVPRNSLTSRAGSYDLDITATLEKPSEDRAILHREMPLFAWFEVSPQNSDKRPSSIKVENLLGRPAPAWRLTGAPWVPATGQSEVRVAPARPRVEAFWLEREPPAARTLEFSSLNVADRELQAKDRKFAVDNGNVEITDLTTGGGYLTLRLTHDPGKPVLVRVLLQGITQQWTLGEEHRFFGNANRYTATFGPLRPEDVSRRLTLQFYSVKAIKEMSKPVSLDLPNSPEPNRDDKLPTEKPE
jgi:hypothetical protein